MDCFMDSVLVSEAIREEVYDAVRAATGVFPRTREELDRLLERSAVDPGLRSRLFEAIAAVAARNGVDVESDADVPVGPVLELCLTG